MLSFLLIRLKSVAARYLEGWAIRSSEMDPSLSLGQVLLLVFSLVGLAWCYLIHLQCFIPS